MSRLSKWLGLDKRPELLRQINAAAQDALLDAATRATTRNLKQLVIANDTVAFAHRVLQSLAAVPGAPDPKDKLAKLVAELRDSVGLK